jgi:hypothetical protein
MKLVVIIALALALLGPHAAAQNGAARAWQQRIDVEIDLPIPVVELAVANPFAITVEQPPQLLSSTPPRKLDVQGSAIVAAYVDAKGECRGGVPLELPFPGLTTAILDEIRGSRFDPAKVGDASAPSWAVVGLDISGRVKESNVVSPIFELPDPTAPPEPAAPLGMIPSGQLINAPYTPHDELTTFAAPRRLKVKAPSQDAEIPVRALVHITATGRCDRFVPLNLESGLHRWLSAYLATWRLEPARLNGEPHEAWVVYSARAELKLSALDSDNVRMIRDRSFVPPTDD